MSNRARALVAAVALSSLALAACGTRVHNAGSQTTTGNGAATSASTNTASDTGVTPTSIKVGIVNAANSGLGPDVFSASRYGAEAYFDALNDQGGVNGRKIAPDYCDDGGDGGKNVTCVKNLIDSDKIFAMAGSSIFNYAGASYVNSQGVPDVGGQPIQGSAYNQYPNLYSIYGGFGYPRDGKQAGYNGQIVSSTANYRWFKQNLGVTTAAVVFFKIQQSQQYADEIAAGLRAEGIAVVQEPIDLGLQDWTTAVLDMKRHGVQAVYDALPSSSNVALCKAIQAQGMQIKAKVTTTQSITDDTGATYADTPECLNNLYGISTAQNYNNFADPQVKAYRDAIAKYFPDRVGKMNEWMFEGYISAMWLTDAMKSCGADLTRKCVTNFMTTQSYNANGLLIPRDFKVVEPAPATMTDCLNVLRWTGNAPTGKAGWTSQVADMNKNCFTTNTYSVPAA
jgi:branched-chain amino acid transport system substrate-binding protein